MKKLFFHLIGLSLNLALLGSFANASDLTGPFRFPTAGNLPSGVRNVQIQGFSTQIFSQYDENGEKLPLEKSFEVPITPRNVIDALDNPSDKAEATAFFQQSMDLDDSLGSTTGALNIRAAVTVPIFAYGMTDRWTLGVAIPVIYSAINVDTGFVPSNQGQNVSAQLYRQGQGKKAKEMSGGFAHALSRSIQSYGYKPLEDRRSTEMGDIVIANKLQLHKSETLVVAVQPELTMPSGRTEDVTELIDVAPGDGQVDVGISGLADFEVTSWFGLSGQLGVTTQLPGQRAMRIPQSEDSVTTPDVDPFTTHDLGDKVVTSLVARWTLYEGLTALTGYNYQYKGSDKFSGTLYEEKRYDWLSKNTDQEMHAAQLGLGYSTIPLFRQQKFAVPFDTKISYTMILKGKNVPADNLGSFELSMYF